MSEPAPRPTLPEKTIYHVGISGGKDSAAVLLWLVNESGVPRDHINATFCDIGNDHEWTVEHVELLSRTVHPVETLKPELDYYELARKKKRFPGVKTRFCTEHLKIYPTQEHIGALKALGFTVVAVSGVRADESEARKDLPEWDYSGNMLCHSWRPLIRWKLADVLAIHKKYGVPMNPLYSMGARRVGCFPCIMSRKSEIRMISINFPERIDMIERAENAFETDFGRYSSFFPSAVVPPRFRSKEYVSKDGTRHMVATIRDVVKWSLTGDRARGRYDDNQDIPGLGENPMSCQSGFCE